MTLLPESNGWILKIMNLIGCKVQHQNYGIGVIVGQEGKTIRVQFDGQERVREFFYPSNYDTKLTLVDGNADVRPPESRTEGRVPAATGRQDNAAGMHGRSLTPRPGNSGEMSVDGGNSEAGGCSGSSGPQYTRMSPGRRAGMTPEVFYAKYRAALNDEIEEVRTAGRRKVRVTSGVLVKRVKRTEDSFLYYYTFETEEELKYPEDTPVNIWKKDNTQISGSVIGCEDFIIILCVSKHLGTTVEWIDVSAEPWMLLEELGNQLQERLKEPGLIASKLISEGRNCIDYSRHTITTGQEAAIRMALTQPITFVWGPPGTGKTETLAEIAVKYLERGDRVLMLSYSNISVDGAVLRTAKKMKRADKLTPGVVLRYGYPREKDLLEHPYLTSFNLVIRRHPDLLKQQRALKVEQKRTPQKSSRYAEIRLSLNKIRDELEADEKWSVEQARFVATTVSKAVVDRTIREQNFDVVIFDEASMAYIPQIVYAATLAQKHFVCMGDFRQLPPIVQSGKGSALNEDIFEYCGITSSVEMKCHHSWLCMLDTQYRMHPAIADFVGKRMYNGLLKSFGSVRGERQPITDAGPLRGKAVSVVDLSGSMSVCIKTRDESRFNVLSALVAVKLAIEAAENYEVGIITPYRAQARLLHAMIRDAAEQAKGQGQDAQLKSIACATVHQFQGSEKDIIIYDAVDCFRMPYPGMLLTSTQHAQADRLFNVAMTRAKGKFICITNVDYMMDRLPGSLLFHQLLTTHKGTYVDVGKVLSARSASLSAALICYDGKTGRRAFIGDLQSAKKEIYIDIPGGVREEDGGDDAKMSVPAVLKALRKRGVKVTVRAEAKSGLSGSWKSICIENPAAINPVAVVDKETVWFGEPESTAQFVSEGRKLPVRYRPIIRCRGKNMAGVLYSILNFSNTVDRSTVADINEHGGLNTLSFANYVLANVKCSKCGKPMRLQKSRQGRFFLSCTAYPDCSGTQSLDVDRVESYLRMKAHGPYGKTCPKCGRSLEAVRGPYGVYVRCCGIGQHKIKLGEI